MLEICLFLTAISFCFQCKTLCWLLYLHAKWRNLNKYDVKQCCSLWLLGNKLRVSQKQPISNKGQRLYSLTDSFSMGQTALWWKFSNFPGESEINVKSTIVFVFLSNQEEFTEQLAGYGMGIVLCCFLSVLQSTVNRVAYCKHVFNIWPFHTSVDSYVSCWDEEFYRINRGNWESR